MSPLKTDPRVWLHHEPEGPEGPRWRGTRLTWGLVNRYLEGIALIDPGYQAEVERARAVVPSIPATSDDQRAFVQALGQALFALLPDELAQALTEGTERIRLVIGERDDAGLPWEYLWAPGHDRPLLLQDHVDLVRCTDTTAAEERASPPAGPLRVLPIAVQPEPGPAAPFQPVDLERDLRPLLRSLPPALRLPHRVHPRAEQEEAFKLDTLDALLDATPASVMHIAAHGSGPRILLCDEQGLPYGVTGARLGGLLRDRDLQLVVLSACGGAGTFEHRGATAKLAADISEAARLPWLLASRVSLSSRVVRAFFPPFYRCLATTGDVEEATRAGRRALFSAGIWCFGGLVLYSSSPHTPRRSFALPAQGASSTDPTAKRPWREGLRGLRAIPTWAWLAVGAAATVGATTWLSDLLAERHAARSNLTRLGTLNVELDEWLAQGREAQAWAALEDLEADLAAQQGSSDHASAAWLDHHARLRHAGDHERALEALVRSFQAARSDPQAARTLATIGTELEDRWNWDGAAVALHALATRHPDQWDQPSVQALRTRQALLRWDLDAATLALDGLAATTPSSPLLAWRSTLENLAPATRLAPKGFEVVAVADYDGDNEAELLLASQTELRILGLGAALGSVTSIPAPDYPGDLRYTAIPMPGDQPDLLLVNDHGHSSRGGHSRLMSLGDGKLVELSDSWDSNAGTAAIGADLDRDGTTEIYLAEAPMGRHLFRLDPTGDGRWAVTSQQALESRQVARSDIIDLELADLDRDGEQELALSVAAWHAYEVRVLGWHPGDAALRTEWRRKLGHVRDLAILQADPPILAAAKERLFPSRVALDPDRPWGDPEGIYLFQRSADDFEQLDYAHSPGPVGDQGHLFHSSLSAADLDGDGVQELVSGVSSWSVGEDATWMASLGTPTRNEGFLTGAFSAVLALEADGSPGSELLVRDASERDLWLLGAGAETLPPLVLDAGPVDIDPQHTPAWTSAETLASASMFELAAEAFQRVALQATTPQKRQAAKLRSAELWSLAGKWQEASKAYEDLLSSGAPPREPDLRERIGKGAVEAHLRNDDFTQAWAALQSTSEAPQDSQAGDLVAALANDLQAVHFDFRDAPSPAWRVEDPLAITRRPDGVEVRFTGIERTTAAWLPLYWGGRALHIELDIDLETVEWSSGLDIALLAEGDRSNAHLLRLGVNAQGGGGMTRLRVGCDGQQVGTLPACGGLWDMNGSDAVGKLHLEVTMIPELNLGHCRFYDQAGSIVHDGAFEPPEPPPAGRYDLVVWSGPRETYGGHLGRFVLEDMRLSGLDITVLDSPPSDDTLVAHRAWFDGDASTAASATLPQPSSRKQQLWRSLALWDAGQPREATATLSAFVQATMGSPAPESWATFEIATLEQRWLADLLRVDRDHHGPLLRRSIGDRAWLWALYRDAWLRNHANQADHEGARRVCDDALAELAHHSAKHEASSSFTALHIGLLHQRGVALRGLNRLAAAHRDLVLAADLAKAGLPPDLAPALEPDDLAPGEPKWLLEKAIQCELELTRLEASLDRQPQALAHATEAHALGGSEDWITDTLMAHPRIRTWVRERTEWSELFGDVVWIAEVETE